MYTKYLKKSQFLAFLGNYVKHCLCGLTIQYLVLPCLVSWLSVGVRFRVKHTVQKLTKKESKHQVRAQIWKCIQVPQFCSLSQYLRKFANGYQIIRTQILSNLNHVGSEYFGRLFKSIILNNNNGIISSMS